MTKDEYNQAGKIFEEIEKLESLIRTLQWSIENHERNLKENRYKYNRFIRLLNFTKDYNDEKKATVFLFTGVSSHGSEIDVDQEFCEVILEYFKNKLSSMRAEVERLGKGNET